MYLRRLVRGAINAVNHDQLIPWLASQGPINDNTTTISTPTYAPVQNIWAQVQPLPTDDLAHMEQLNIQGVLRQVYMKGAVASAVRQDNKGGDLLQFPEILGGPQRTWLVMRVMEQWDSWCLVIVRLQNDMNWAWTADSSVTADTSETSDA
ncbi:MAG: hypothetical protein WBW93_13915 [Steroidobacteraceae bacterium]